MRPRYCQYSRCGYNQCGVKTLVIAGNLFLQPSSPLELAGLRVRAALRAKPKACMPSRGQNQVRFEAALFLPMARTYCIYVHCQAAMMDGDVNETFLYDADSKPWACLSDV